MHRVVLFRFLFIEGFLDFHLYSANRISRNDIFPHRRRTALSPFWLASLRLRHRHRHRRLCLINAVKKKVLFVRIMSENRRHARSRQGRMNERMEWADKDRREREKREIWHEKHGHFPQPFVSPDDNCCQVKETQCSTVSRRNNRN